MNSLIGRIKNAKKVFVCGNGGSSATAEHLTSDLFSRGIRAYCLNSNTSIMTMIANDFGYEDVFSRQLELYATKNDLLITISASGTSPNIVEAITAARIKSMDVYSFKKFDEDRDYEKIEDEHLKFAHKLKKQL